MKTKSLFMAVLAMASIALVSSCNGPEEDLSTKVTLSGLESSISFAATDPTDVQFLIQSNRDWKITVKDADWLTVTPSEGLADKSSKVTVKAEPNTAVDPRSGSFTITSGEDFTQTVSVSQAAANAELTVSGIENNAIEFESVSSTSTFSVSSNVPWTIELKDLDWCTVTPVEGTSGTAEITVSAVTNEVAEARAGQITFKSAAQDLVIAVSQKEATPTMVVEQKEAAVEGVGGSATITVTSNTTWTAVPSDDWVTVSPATGIGEKVSVTITGAENPYKERKATVTFKAVGLEDQIVELTQPIGNFKPYILCEWNTDYASTDEFKVKQPNWPVNDVKGTYNTAASLIAVDGANVAEWYIGHAEPFVGIDYTRFNNDGDIAVVGSWVGDGLRCHCKNVTLKAGYTLAFYTGLKPNGTIGKWGLKFSTDGGNTWTEVPDVVHQRADAYDRIVNNNLLWDFYGKVTLDKDITNGEIVFFMYAAEAIKSSKNGDPLNATSDPSSVAFSLKLKAGYNSFNGNAAPYIGPTIVVE